jgi:hypothetical protein
VSGTYQFSWTTLTTSGNLIETELRVDNVVKDTLHISLGAGDISLLQLHCIQILSVGFLNNRLILFFINLGKYQHLVEKFCVTFVQMKRDFIDN